MCSFAVKSLHVDVAKPSTGEVLLLMGEMLSHTLVLLQKLWPAMYDIELSLLAAWSKKISLRLESRSFFCTSFLSIGVGVSLFFESL